MDFTLGERLRLLPGPIMVTGHTGFKGTWLTFLLEHLQVPVVGFSLAPEVDSLFDRAKRINAIPEVFADIRNIQALTRFMSKHQPSAVIHMAAQPLVLESYETPRQTFETNVLGTVNVLDSAFHHESVKAVIAVTTDKVYRNDNLSHAFVESDALAGNDPYSASKVGTEAAVSAWQQIAKVSGGPKVISVRAGNVIGGGDWAKNRLMPDLVRSFIAGEPIQIRNPQSTRPWQHVLDPLRGYLMAMEAIFGGAEFSSLNFGPSGDGLSVKEVVDLGISCWPENAGFSLDNNVQDCTPEATDLQINSLASKALLDWEPRWSQQEAIFATISWWRRVLKESHGTEEACRLDINSIL